MPGAAVNLISDPEVLEPYVEELLPLLQDRLVKYHKQWILYVWMYIESID